jgi:hypothetical protein
LIALHNFRSGPDKEAFHRYLADFDAVDCEAALLDSLSNCSDLLPKRYADSLGLPPGSAYRDAVQLLLCSWTPSLRAPGEHSFD